MSLKIRPEKIMLFVESSEKSIVAAQYSTCLAKWLNCSIVAVYVVDIKTLQDLTRAKIFIKMEEMDYERDLEDNGRRYLNHVRDIAEEKGVFIETVLLKGDVFGEVHKKIKEEEADILVMGELEEPECRRDFYYNESERIFRRSPCPVVVVRGQDDVKSMYENL